MITQSLCLAKTNSVDDRSVVQFIGNDCVVRTEKRLKQAAVGIEAGGIQNCIFRSDEPGNAAFQFLMNPLRAANEANRGKPKAPFIIGLLCCFDQRRVCRQAEIVVGAKVDDTFGFCGVDARVLGRRDDALILVSACLADRVQFLPVD